MDVHVIKPTVNLPFGDDVYHPFLVKVGMIIFWVYHISIHQCDFIR